MDELRTRKAWRDLGRSVPGSAIPARVESWSYPGSGSGERHLFSFEQTRELRKTREARVLQDVLGCLFTLNRRAKRCGDLAPKYYRRRMHGFAATLRE